MRKSRSTWDVFTVAGTVVQIAPFSPNRVALVIGPPATNTLFVGIDGSVLATTGLRRVQTNEPIILNIQDHGDLVRHAFFAVATGGNAIIQVWQTLLDEK